LFLSKFCLYASSTMNIVKNYSIKISQKTKAFKKQTNVARVILFALYLHLQQKPLKSRKSSLFLCSNFNMLLSRFYLCIQAWTLWLNQTLNLWSFLQFDICEKSSIKSDSNVVCLHFYLFAWCHNNHQPISRFFCFFFFCIHIIYVWKNL
jgi:hypothetical protein